jgi:hypothetical protein
MQHMHGTRRQHACDFTQHQALPACMPLLPLLPAADATAACHPPPTGGPGRPEGDLMERHTTGAAAAVLATTARLPATQQASSLPATPATSSLARSSQLCHTSTACATAAAMLTCHMLTGHMLWTTCLGPMADSPRCSPLGTQQHTMCMAMPTGKPTPASMCCRHSPD